MIRIQTPALPSQRGVFRRTLWAALAVLMLASALACHKQVTPHPNQINAFDGQTYDTLVSAQAALDEAKLQFKSGKLPQESKAIINEAGAAYEQARSAWLLWRDATLGLKAGDASTLQSRLEIDMQQLAAALANVRRMTGGQR